MSRNWLLAVLFLAGCSFPSDGVLFTGDPPDAEVVPLDACAPVTEACDGVDNDCDSNVDEGLTSGAACDGPDADLCLDDVTICDDTGAEVCAPGADNAELCNTTDDDCDLAVDEDFALGAACDGLDGDECDEGNVVCSVDELGTTCNDATDTIVEVCNLADDDCDGIPDDGIDTGSDEANCGSCGNTCTNGFGTTMCTTGMCMPICSNGAALCNADPDDGCELQNTNPGCPFVGADPLVPPPDIMLSGDAVIPEVVTFKGSTEALLRVRLRETRSPLSAPITASIELVSGVGATYHLTVHCQGCPSGAPMTDIDDVIEVGRDDASGDRSYDVYVQISYDATMPSTTCAQWTLTVTGTSTTTNRCAN